MDLRKRLFQLVKSEHCRISHHEREDHRGKHHIPHHSDLLDGTICKESAERQHQRNDHRQSIRRQLVLGYFLEHLHHNVRQHHQHANDADDDRPVQYTLHILFLLLSRPVFGRSRVSLVRPRVILAQVFKQRLETVDQHHADDLLERDL